MTLRIALPAVLIALAGCSWLNPTKEEMTLKGAKDSITVAQLEREVQDLADCFAMGVAEGCDRIRRQDPRPEVQRGTLYLKLRNATSAYDVVTAGDALEGLLDLVTLIELQNVVWLDEGRIERLPKGQGTDFLQSVLTRSRGDAWALTGRALSKEQIGKVRKVIQEWRRRNPDVQWVAFSRFSSGASASSSNVLNEIRSQLGGILNPFGSTTHSVDETREVAVKALYYSKRLPILLEWEAQAAALGITDLPAIVKLQQDVSTITQSAAELPTAARSLALAIAVGIAALMIAAFGLVLAYRRISLGWERRLKPATAARPPTRPLPTA